MIDYTKLGKEPWKLGREQLESESSYSDGVYSTFGGISFKNKKRNRNSKTKKNKIKSKKDTIKKRNKRNNKTRKH
jgi:galactokinase/mevalonate kinase-like predicted kinase